MPESTTAQTVFDVAIVGAGIPGSAVALALALQGKSVAVIDPAEVTAWDAQAYYDLRMYAIAPASQQFLADLGLWDAIAAARISPYQSMTVWDAGRGGELGFTAAEAGRTELGWIVENRLIAGLLREALLDQENIHCLIPATMLACKIETDRAELQLDNGDSLQARLLVAADGARSAARSMLGLETVQWRYGQTAIVANVTTTQSHQYTAWQRFLPTGPLAFLPLDDGRSSIVWTVDDDTAAALLKLDDAEFCQVLTEGFDSRLGQITQTSPRAGFPLHLLHAKRYAGNRFALLGDAAHNIHPLAGQGVNLGLADAAALSQALSTATDPGSLLPLRRYERTRKPDNLAMLAVTDSLNRLFASQATPVASVRSAGLSMLNRIPPAKKRLIRQAMGL